MAAAEATGGLVLATMATHCATTGKLHLSYDLQEPSPVDNSQGGRRTYSLVT